jgi:hypothetical protein
VAPEAEWVQEQKGLSAVVSAPRVEALGPPAVGAAAGAGIRS